MRYIEPARNSRNSVMHIGTNAIFRRKYVEEVGLYPTNSITEDMALGLLLQAKGYDSIYVNKALVCGLSAFTYEDLIKQRDRWARGNLQVLKHYKKEIFRKLKFNQKMIYLDGILYWFSGLMKLIFIITPIIFLLTGFTIVNIPPRLLLPIFLAAFSLQILLSKYILPEPISSHYFKFFMRSEFFNIIIAPHMAFSVLKHFFGHRIKKSKFNVTRKNLVTNKGHYYFKYAIIHLLLLICGIVAIVVGTLKLNNGLYWDSYLINVFWVSYNIPGLLVALKIAYQPPRNLSNESIVTFNKNGYKRVITDIEISEYINDLAYSELEKTMNDVVNNIEPYKSNFKL